MHRWIGRLSPATVMSAIALFVSLGGVGYAATQIGSAQIADDSVRSRDIKNRTIAAVDLRRSTIASLRGHTGPAGPQGADGEPGPRGPSDVFEAVQTNDFVAAAAGARLSVVLRDLPPGSYVVHGKASLGPISSHTPAFDAGQCVLTAGTDEDRGIEDWDPSEASFKTIDTELTHTFDATGTVTMSCGFDSEDFRMGTGGPRDTRIIAVRVDHRTRSDVVVG